MTKYATKIDFMEIIKSEKLAWYSIDQRYVQWGMMVGLPGQYISLQLYIYKCFNFVN